MTTDPIGETAPESARALLWRHGLPEDVLDGALTLHAQELAARIRTTDLPDWADTVDLFDNGTAWAADLIDPTVPDDTDLTEADVDRMMAAGVPVQIVTAPPDTHAAVPADPQTDLRDRIAALFRHRPGDERLGDATPGEIADAVLPVLRALTLRELEQLARPNTPPSSPEPKAPPADRAAVLRELIAKAEEWDGHITVQELRRLAAEAQQPGHVYLSTGCLHGEHAYCANVDGIAGLKKPAQCKFCAAPCTCPCHTEQQPDTETLRTAAVGPAPKELHIRVLREVLARMDGSRGDGDSATEDVGAATVRTVLVEILAGMQPTAGRAADTEAQQPETEAPSPVHAVPLPGSNGISSCCGRPPCEFVGERVTRNPDEVTCTGRAVPQQPAAADTGEEADA